MVTESATIDDAEIGDAAGWDEESEEFWDWRYEELADFKDYHGHCNVPEDYPDNPSLAKWVDRQRKLKWDNKMTDDHFEALNELKFDFKLQPMHWEQRYQELLAFRDEHGHCNVPKKYDANPKLGFWVKNQRIFAKMRSLSGERYDRLKHLGFDFGEEEYGKAKDAEDQELGSRTKQMSSSLLEKSNSRSNYVATPDKPRRYTDKEDETWNRRYDGLVKFKMQRGHCRVTQNSTLGGWVNTQRLLRRANKLPTSRVDKLNLLGFEWEHRTRQWERMFEALVEFKDRHGHCNVPQKYGEVPGLGRWVGNQRHKARHRGIPKDRMNKLVKLGFDFRDTRYGPKDRKNRDCDGVEYKFEMVT